MTKVAKLKEQLRVEEENQRNAQREARDLLEPIYIYHTDITPRGGISIVGELQNKEAFDAHMAEYGSITNMPETTTRGVEHLYTIDGWLIRTGGGWLQPQLPREDTKISVSEWEQLKKSVYPKRLKELR